MGLEVTKGFRIKFDSTFVLLFCMAFCVFLYSFVAITNSEKGFVCQLIINSISVKEAIEGALTKISDSYFKVDVS